MRLRIAVFDDISRRTVKSKTNAGKYRNRQIITHQAPRKNAVTAAFYEALQGTEYPDTDSFWIDKSIINLVMLSQLIDKDKGVPHKLPNGQNNPESLETKINNVSFTKRIADIDISDKTKKPKYKSLNKYQLAFHHVYELQEDREQINAEHLAVRNEILDEYDKMCQRHANDPDFQKVKPLLDFNLIIEDPENGVYDTPLDILKSFFKATEDLYELEGQKQKMHKNGYTPEQEEEYLGKLKGKMQNSIESYNKIYDFILLHGEEPEFTQGEYMNNGIDHITGIHNDNDRSCHQQIGQMKGQIKAIENGWGMDELVSLGSVGEMIASCKFYIKRADHYISADIGSNNVDRKKIEVLKADPKTTPEQLAAVENSLKNGEERLERRKRRKIQDNELAKDLDEFAESVFNKKVRSPAEKLSVISRIDKFVKEAKEKYPDTIVVSCFTEDLKELLKDQKAKTIEASMDSAKLDSAVSELKAGNKGTWFGKKDYDKVITNLASLNAIYDSRKEAFLAGENYVAPPGTAAKEKETLKNMDSYILRKEIEFRNNAIEGKENNANSMRRYEAMKKSRETLLKRIEVNEAISGKEPEPHKKAVKEPKLNIVMPALDSRYNNDTMPNSVYDRKEDADYIRSHDPCFRDIGELQKKMKNIRKDLEATSMFGGSSVEFKRMMRAFEELEANVVPVLPDMARINKMNALILLKNAAEDYINKKHIDAGVDLDKELVPSTSAGKKHLRGAKDALAMVNEAIENMNQVAVNEEHLKQEPLIHVDDEPEMEDVVNEKPDIEKKQEQKAPEEKKEESFTIQGQLKEAQSKLSALGEQVNAENLKKPLSQIITCYKIAGLQKQNLFKNITKVDFDKIENACAIKDPIFNEMLKRNEPKELASQALNDKGQNLFANYQRTSVAVKEEQKRKAENNLTVVNNKELSSSKLDDFHKQ